MKSLPGSQVFSRDVGRGAEARGEGIAGGLHPPLRLDARVVATGWGCVPCVHRIRLKAELRRGAAVSMALATRAGPLCLLLTHQLCDVG